MERNTSQQSINKSEYYETQIVSIPPLIILEVQQAKSDVQFW